MWSASSIFAVQMVWIPFWAAGVINGVGHYWGYRNFETQDTSRNIVPIGVLIGGEEFHNNHHAYGYVGEAREQVVGARHRLGLHSRCSSCSGSRA